MNLSSLYPRVWHLTLKYSKESFNALDLITVDKSLIKWPASVESPLSDFQERNEPYKDTGFLEKKLFFLLLFQFFDSVYQGLI